MEFEPATGRFDEDTKEEFPPLPSDIDQPSSANTPDPYDNRRHAVDIFYCMSPPLPSPPPPLPSATATATIERVYANARTFSSIRTQGSFNPMTVAFATQQKKKARAPLACQFQGTYVNIPMSPPLPPPPTKPVSTANEVTYATLMNTTSLVSPVGSDVTNNHVEYQQIEIKRGSGRGNSARIYENVKPRRPPPMPCYASSSPQPRPPSTCAMPVEIEPSPAEHTYINLEYQEDKPPTIPSRTNRPIPIAVQVSPPPIIPPRQEPRGSSRNSVVNPTPSPEQDLSQEKDGSGFETSSNASTIKMVNEASPRVPTAEADIYQKKPLTANATTTDNPSATINARQRRALHSIRRRRLRGSIAVRNSGRTSANAGIHRAQQQRTSSNAAVRHPMMTDDRWRRTLRKRRRQRVVQMQLDGNALHQQIKSIRPAPDHTYNEIKQPILPPAAGRANGHNGAAGGVLERAMQFNGALRDRVFSWYRGANQNDRELQQLEQLHTATPQACSTSDNADSDQKGSATNGEDEDEEVDPEDVDDEDEEEFFTHDTFEDFLLRRRPKSSASTTVSGTSTMVSQIEFVPQRSNARTPPKPKLKPPPSRPPPPPPLPPSSPPTRRFPGLALGLDKTDVDFIHNILQRTRGENRVWNRITALKEAYIRATSKKHDQPKKPKPAPTKMDEQKKKVKTIKHSLAATKVRAELEKYDELPASSATVIDDDDYDETCMTNEQRRMNYNPHHRSAPTLPPTPSAAHRMLSFVTSIKRRAQSNVQQFQKNLHEIRSRIHMESMTASTGHVGVQRHHSFMSRNKPPLKDHPSTSRIRPIQVESTPPINSLVRRANSHRSATSTEHSIAARQQSLNRTQSNASQLPQQLRHTHRQHHRPAIEKPTAPADRAASLTSRPPPLESRPSRQTHNTAVSHRQHARKT